ncbi:MAG: hypothetical protein ACOYM7_05900, partial [Paludibacter sp.]
SMKYFNFISRSKFYSRISFYLVGIVLIIIPILSSCNLDVSSNYTPRISFLQAPILQNGDSLHIKYTSTEGEFLMDTISVGDTVMFVLHLNAYSNNLTNFVISQSADSVSRLVLPNKSSLDSITLPTSDYKLGRFAFKPNYSMMIFSFGYVATNTTKNSKFSVYLESDAKFDMGFMGRNSHSFKLITPIKARMQ